MEAIYYDSLKMIPSSTANGSMLNLPNVIILPNVRTSNISVANLTLHIRTEISTMDHVIPGPERDLPSRPWDTEPGIDIPMMPDDPGELPIDPDEDPDDDYVMKGGAS